MSPLLLDTHVLVWLLAGSDRLGLRARASIDAASAVEGLFVSAITPWEIAMLVAKGRLVLARDVGDWVQAALALPGIRLEALSPAVAVASTRLPGALHADPTDRIIVATARHLGAALVTADGLLLDYASSGNLKVLPAGQ